MVVYKPHDVGWLSCLSCLGGNAKARSWDKQGSFSHVFFYGSNLIYFEIIWEKFRGDLASSIVANSGLFAKAKGVEIPKRTTDNPKSAHI